MIGREMSTYARKGLSFSRFRLKLYSVLQMLVIKALKLEIIRVKICRLWQLDGGLAAPSRRTLSQVNLTETTRVR